MFATGLTAHELPAATSAWRLWETHRPHVSSILLLISQGIGDTKRIGDASSDGDALAGDTDWWRWAWSKWVWLTHATVSASHDHMLSATGASVYIAHRGWLGMVMGISPASTGSILVCLNGLAIPQYCHGILLKSVTVTWKHVLITIDWPFSAAFNNCKTISLTNQRWW